MPITFTAIAAGTVPAAAEAEVVGVLVTADGRPVEGAGVEIDLQFLQRHGFEGNVGEAVTLRADDGGSVVVLGLGPADGVDAEAVRRAGAALAKAAWRATSAAFVLPPGAVLDTAVAARAAVEGIGMRAYQFGEYKSAPKPCALERVTVVGGEADAVARGSAVVQAVTLCRDLVNTPAGGKPPSKLADLARTMGEQAGLQVTILDEAAIERERLGGLLGVSLGSVEPPRLIRLEYTPPGVSNCSGNGSGNGNGAGVPTVVLVGKGITFDSGGLSLKSGDGMMHMKTDMGGGAAVISAMCALPALAPQVRVVGIVPATENMPSGRAIKPGDVLRFRNGKTAEILNTDAEGRLILADGLSLAAELEPAAIIDLATLTGACIMALGREITGVMGNNDDLAQQLLAASERAGEAMWQLPLPARYRKHIDSEVADMKNIGAPGNAGALLAGLFLQEFVGDTPWVHLDIAGPSWTEVEDGYTVKGGTGVGVRTLLELLASFEPVA